MSSASALFAAVFPASAGTPARAVQGVDAVEAGVFSAKLEEAVAAALSPSPASSRTPGRLSLAGLAVKPAPTVAPTAPDAEPVIVAPVAAAPLEDNPAFKASAKTEAEAPASDPATVMAASAAPESASQPIAPVVIPAAPPPAPASPEPAQPPSATATPAFAAEAPSHQVTGVVAAPQVPPAAGQISSPAPLADAPASLTSDAAPVAPAAQPAAPQAAAEAMDAAAAEPQALHAERPLPAVVQSAAPAGVATPAEASPALTSPSTAPRAASTPIPVGTTEATEAGPAARVPPTNAELPVETRPVQPTLLSAASAPLQDTAPASSPVVQPQYSAPAPAALRQQTALIDTPTPAPSMEVAPVTSERPLAVAEAATKPATMSPPQPRPAAAPIARPQAAPVAPSSLGGTPAEAILISDPAPPPAAAEVPAVAAEPVLAPATPADVPASPAPLKPLRGELRSDDRLAAVQDPPSADRAAPAEAPSAAAVGQAEPAAAAPGSKLEPAPAPPPPPTSAPLVADAPPPPQAPEASIQAADRNLGLSTLSRATVETTAQLAAQIVRKLEGRSTRFDMVLTPEDLGRVDVSLEIDADGQLAARLAFDNPAAAADLRGRADELRRQLQDAGFQVSNDSLSFSQRDPSAGGGFDRQQQRNSLFAGGSRLAAQADAPSVPAPGAWINLSLTPDRVDVKV